MKFTGNRELWGWIALGFAGLLFFMVLKERFDFMANAPVTYSKEEATEKTRELFSNLGIAPDTLSLIPFRVQKPSLYRAIQDSLGEHAPSAANLNQNNFYLHGWDVIAATTLGINESFNLTPAAIYQAAGVYRTQWDNSGQVKLYQFNVQHGDAPVVLGENNLAYATTLVEEVFGYDLSGYEFLESQDEDEDLDFSAVPDDLTAGRIQFDEADDNTNLYRWRKSDGIYSDYIELDLHSGVHREETETERTEIHGITVAKFEAYNEIEKLSPADLNQQFVIFFFIVIGLLALFVFIEGFGQLFKGNVDWNRILFVSIIAGTAIFGWRFIFLMNFTDLFTMQANIVVQFNQLIYGLVMGIFAAIAYIGWEAYARSEKQFQIDLMDAFWRGKFFLRETGSAILKGFSLGGILLGITALYLTFSGIHLFQSDSQFGFTEVLNRPFILSLNMSVFVTSAICAVALVGVIYNFFDKRIRIKKLALLLSILIGGMLFAGTGRTFGTSATIVQDVLLFSLIAIPLFSAYKLSGVVTVFSGLWLFTSLTNILPYIQSPAPDVAINAWLQILLAVVILIFGIVAFIYGTPLATVSSYIPDYEKKLIRNLRFENEMLIARETQEKLMPLHHPATDDFELYGYFIPSFEVGGDYFDYVMTPDGNTEQHLTLTVVDVSGKSMRAAMHAVFTSGLLRSRMYTDLPSKILREISPVIFEKTDSQTFITCIIGRYEPAGKVLKLANAGHCLPVLKRDGKARFLQTEDPKYPLGVRPQVDYTDVSVELKSGDMVLFYSDGFPEAVNDQGERIGFDRALQFVETLETDRLHAREICNEIREYIRQYSIERLADDTTILCLKIR